MSKLLRYCDLEARGLIKNWATLRRWIRDPNVKFPPGRLIGPQTRVWTEEELATWIESRPAEPGPLRGCVKRQAEEAAR